MDKLLNLPSPGTLQGVGWGIGVEGGMFHQFLLLLPLWPLRKESCNSTSLHVDLRICKTVKKNLLRDVSENEANRFIYILIMRGWKTKIRKNNEMKADRDDKDEEQIH